MTKHGLLFCGLLLAVSPSVKAEMGWYEGVWLSAGLVATYPVVTGTSVLLSTTATVAHLKEGDQRVLLNARDGALRAVADGNLDDARLQSALELLRRRYPLDDVDDLQLAQWIAARE